MTRVNSGLITCFGQWVKTLLQGRKKLRLFLSLQMELKRLADK